MAAKYESMFERLIANSHKPDDQNENGCWPWAGVLGTRNYGIVSVREPGRRTPRSVFAHRAMEQAFRNAEAQRKSDDAQPLWGPLPTVTAPPLRPDDETIDHLCYLRRCVHPDHWNVETRARNTALMQSRKKPSCAAK